MQIVLSFSYTLLYRKLENDTRFTYTVSMKSRSALIVSLFLFIVSTQVTGAAAQVVTPGTSSTTINEVNCDLCGYCKGQPAPQNWEKCRNCLYKAVAGASAEQNRTLEGIPTPDPGHHYTTLGCLSTDPGKFSGQVSTFFFSIIGGIAFLYMLYGAGIIATSRADPERLNHGKRVVWGSILGLLFVLFSVFIIRLLATSLGIPEIGE